MNARSGRLSPVEVSTRVADPIKLREKGENKIL